MKKNIFFLLLFFSINSAFARDQEQIFAGISFTAKGSNFYIKYKQQDEIAMINDDLSANLPEIKLSFNNNLFDNINKTTMHYSGYKNVEGFKNNKRKNDVIFGGTVISVGVIALTAVTVAVVAIAAAL